MSGYKRPTNGEFNVELDQRLKAQQAERDDLLARIDAASPAFVKATQQTLDSFKDRSTAWWWYRIVREFLTQCWEKCWEFITRRPKQLYGSRSASANARTETPPSDFLETQFTSNQKSPT